MTPVELSRRQLAGSGVRRFQSIVPALSVAAAAAAATAA